MPPLALVSIDGCVLPLMHRREEPPLPPVEAVERLMRMSPLLAAGGCAHSGKPMVTAAARAPGEVQGAAPLWAVQQVLLSSVRSSEYEPG